MAELRRARRLYRFHQYAEILMRLGIGNRFLLVELPKFCPRLLNGYVWFQPRYSNKSVVYMLGQIIVILTQWHPDIRPAQQIKPRRQHSDNRVAIILKRDLPPNYPGISS